jgi:hypothetical protein
MASLGRTLRAWWAGLTGRGDLHRELPPVVVHDPAAHRAHDLDDPFVDDAVKSRIGDVIAHTAQQKEGKLSG